MLELPVTSMFDNCISTFIVNDDENNVMRPLQNENQMKKFLHRLNQCQKSIHDQTNDDRKIVIIKEIPGIFLTKPDLLHEELKSYKMKMNRSESIIVPIVFIISTTAQGENLEQKILPRHIINLLNFKVITFKPITETCLTKVIENSSIENPLNGSQIQEIISASSGDVRHALNYLKFQYSSSNNKNNKRTKKLKCVIQAPRDNVSSINCDRNDSLTLSHAIAKILYAKRLENREDFVIEYIRKNPNCDKSKLRNPLKDSRPEEIAELANISYDLLIDWIYENYQDFIHDPDDLEKCCDCLQALCDSTNSVIDNYSERDSFKNIQTSMAIRGMLFNLNTDNYVYQNYIEKPMNRMKKTNQFRQLNPPKTFSMNKILHNNRTEMTKLRNMNSTFFQFDNEKNLIMDILPMFGGFPKSFSNEHPYLDFINNLIDFKSTETKKPINYLVSTSSCSSSLIEIDEQDDVHIEDDSD
ncbi:hypothetical protein BLA29_000061 [Euroglyphus maynei]|uniref:Uncharacterized protein n=1 Tax=Euroglyphus maynei TaxID=6958 RepID=A0A1Y3AU88_EURMA|nr:hypothetical protein BLA29_000061 [Euroglyphus maynei]